jgi:hypothetical protein
VQLQERLIEQALGEDAAPLWEAKHDGHSIDMARVRLDFQAVLERALRLQLVSSAPAARARAEALGRHWLEVARAAERGEPNDIYTFQLATAFLLALASFGPRLGLEQEVEALLTTLPEKPDGGVRLARFLFERARR